MKIYIFIYKENCYNHRGVKKTKNNKTKRDRLENQKMKTKPDSRVKVYLSILTASTNMKGRERVSVSLYAGYKKRSEACNNSM